MKKTNIRKVPFFDYPQVYLSKKKEILEIIDQVASKGAFIMQTELAEFEEKLAQSLGAKYALGVANATDGLELAWMTQNLSPRDEVIISAHTMLATASSVVVAGGKPVPVDIRSDGLICPSAVKAAITENTVGIMPTQLNGCVCDMDALSDLAEKHNLTIIEDAAQALGAKFKNRYAGTFGVAGCISFYPAKTLGSLGDGGALIIQSSDTYEILRELRDHGRGRDGNVKRWGRNSRLDNIQAAILSYKLDHYEAAIQKRRTLADLYNNELANVKEISLPREPTLNGHFDIYQNYEIQSETRDKLKSFLAGVGIGTLIQWSGEAINQIETLGFARMDCPRTNDYFDRCLMLPMNDFMTLEDAYYVSKKVREFFGA